MSYRAGPAHSAFHFSCRSTPSLVHPATPWRAARAPGKQAKTVFRQQHVGCVPGSTKPSTSCRHRTLQDHHQQQSQNRHLSPAPSGIRGRIFQATARPSVTTSVTMRNYTSNSDSRCSPHAPLRRLLRTPPRSAPTIPLLGNRQDNLRLHLGATARRHHRHSSLLHHL